MLASQGETCNICKKHYTSFTKKLAVDHCHSTGTIRGLLCSDCNLMLGHSKDNPDTLTNAIEYLKKFVS